MTRGSRTISAGGPSAMTSPSWSAMIRWASVHDHAHVVLDDDEGQPRACSSRTRATSPGIAPGSTPPVTSSSRSSRGRVASARASSRRLRWPVERPRACAAARSPRPTLASAASAASRASATSAVSEEGADHHVLERGHLGKGRSFWNVRPTPEPADLIRAQAGASSRPSRRTRAGVRAREARDAGRTAWTCQRRWAR